jgi:hypothetical protein
MSIYIIEAKKDGKGKWLKINSHYYETKEEAEAEVLLNESFYKQDKFRVQEYVRAKEGQCQQK